ncbi:aminotransferase class V-fold PLP-dependent enzyme [Rugamonas sp. DEMB1]|uniref:aminotransferase class V-fold PLP-dependent enzyme n=1 Tax=Rugamonas sp. DEMB1 TaxID=3039386 RepID=UPI002448C934|nr:aminotransferase class V-fold PLP-dependent enzyme [Rugamonas sp. DEMB1]WGG50172.1 aminotransferase class V-fold PLP-dependent enzyme [Rugamonas sp. DEMB1]
MIKTEIYLDGNATSAVLPAAIAAAVDAMGERFGNPSSSHAAGLKAKALLEGVRQRGARLLGVGDGKLLFTSGATEGIQTAVLSALCALRARRAAGEAIGALLVYGATEHKAVPEALAHWNRLLGLDLELHALAVDQDGRHDLAALRALAGRAALVCTMAANNETGVISDLAGIEAVLRDSASAAYWLVDCVQALGKLTLELAASRIDYAPFSGHKLYAPKGIGMLYVRAGAPFTALMMGGGQEGGMRSGTENMAGIAALGAVLEALEGGATFRSHAELAGVRARLADSLRAALPGVVFNNPFAKALPTTLNFSVPGLASGELMDVFDAAGLRVSAGSACSAKKAAPSYVLDAMGLAAWRSSGAIRLSFGALIDDASVAEACARIVRCGEALRASCLLPSAQAPLPHDGVVQLGVEGECSWLVLDAASRSCVVIDALAEHGERIEQFVRCQQYRVRAVLASAAGMANPAKPDGRAALAAALADNMDDGAVDAFGWPAGAAALTLADGGAAEGLALGARTLACARHADGSRSYLLGGGATATALPADAVRFAFCGHAAQPGLAALLAADTLLCPSRDAHNQFCSSPRALRAAPLAAPADTTALQIDAAALAQFLRRHPEALLVDVREPYEYAAAAPTGPNGRAALSVPLSRLAAQLDEWLRGAPVPLVFFCRSGNRSVKAAQCLRRLGYAQAWNLSGGLALAPLAWAA